MSLSGSGCKFLSLDFWVTAPTELSSEISLSDRGSRYAIHANMKATSFEYIDVFYNRKRQHSALDYRSLIQLKEIWLSKQQKKLLA